MARPALSLFGFHRDSRCTLQASLASYPEQRDRVGRAVKSLVTPLAPLHRAASPCHAPWLPDSGGAFEVSVVADMKRTASRRECRQRVVQSWVTADQRMDGPTRGCAALFRGRELFTLATSRLPMDEAIVTVTVRPSLTKQAGPSRAARAESFHT